jgi:formamidopyrimidine-DNA glycosylase
MPELPDVTIYVEHLERRLNRATLENVRVASPNLLRTVAPPLAAALGRRVAGVRRLGKRIVIELEGGLHLVIHLMIAGRFRWRDRGAKVPGKIGLAAFEFSTGTLLLTEASTRQRASLHLVEAKPAWPRSTPAGSSRSRRVSRTSPPRCAAPTTP